MFYVIIQGMKIKSIHTITKGAFNENTYIVEYEDRSCILIDPGLDGDGILKFIKDNDLTLKGTVLTHNHFDHIAAINKEILEGKIYMSLTDKADLLDSSYTTLMYNTYGHYLIENEDDFKSFYSLILSKKDNIIGVKDAEVIQDAFKVIFTPGHTKGSICLLDDDNNVIFTGDTLFKDGYGRYDLPGGDYKTLMGSLDALLKLPEHLKVYSGHGGVTTIGNERKHFF